MHPEWTSQLSAYLDDELDPASRARLEGHLDRCAECRATLEELRRVVAWAPNYAGTEPARDLWPQVREAIDQGKVASLPNRRERPAPRFTWVHLIAAGLVMAVLGGAGAWLMLRRVEARAPMAQGPAPTG